MDTNYKNTSSEKEISPIIIGKLMTISGILNRESNKLLLPYELNQQQFSVLFEIAKVKKVQQKNMVNRLLLEKSHVSKVVKKLRKMGLVKITVLPEDKRSAVLTLTEKGEMIVNICQEMFKQWRIEKLGQFSEKELLQILESIQKLQKAFMNNI